MKVALVIWAVAAPTLMGTFLMTVLLTPALAAQEMQLMLPAIIAGAVLAMPISYIIAKKIMAFENIG